MKELTFYADLLSEIKPRIRQAQVKATLSANAEMLLMYWDIGRMIHERQRKKGWGAGVIPRLAKDIRNDMPEVKGFSERNIKRMLRFYREYSVSLPIVPQPVAQLQPVENKDFIKVPQPVAQLLAGHPPEILRRTVAKIPWGHNILLMEKVKERPSRLWYMQQKYKILFMMAIFTGARQGELLGLQWGDTDWENKQVYIQRTYTKGQFFDTKTKTSRRKIDLAPTMLLQLKKWKLACPPNDLNLIFPNEAGQPMNYSNMMSRHYVPALVRAGIATKLENGKIEGAIRFHDLRHTYASLLIEQGENIKYIQAQLGHSSPMVTLNVYAHLMKPTNQEAAERLEKAIFQSTGQNLVTIEQKGVTA